MCSYERPKLIWLLMLGQRLEPLHQVDLGLRVGEVDLTVLEGLGERLGEDAEHHDELVDLRLLAPELLVRDHRDALLGLVVLELERATRPVRDVRLVEALVPALDVLQDVLRHDVAEQALPVRVRGLEGRP